MKILICLSLVIAIPPARAQELPPNTQQQLEQLAEATETESPEDDQWLQTLDHYRREPLDLNEAGAEDLQGLRFLSALQIDLFLRYRKLLGKLIDIHELQAVPGWDLATIRQLLPYVSIGAALTLKDDLRSRLKNGEHSVLLRLSRALEKSRGYDRTRATHFLGDPNQLMFRYRYQYKNLLYAGITGEKDPGEQFLRGAQAAGFDFYSAHLFLRRLGKIKALAFGDFSLSMGQGLILWQSMGFSKSAESMSVKRQGAILSPYRSAGEFNFNRGVAVTVGNEKWETTVFFSSRKIGGSAADSVDGFTGFQTSGLHRTETEVARKNKVRHTAAGAVVIFRSDRLKLGINGLIQAFDVPLQKRSAPYNAFVFSGSRLWNVSVDYSYTWKNLHLFGELALDAQYNAAFIQGALLSVDPRLDLSFVLRVLPVRYRTLFGNAFTEHTLPVNEQGLYAGLSFKPSRAWQMQAYADVYRSPWLRYRVSAPSSGYDYLLQVGYQPHKKASVLVRYHYEQKSSDLPAPGTMDYPAPFVKRSLRLHLTDQLSSLLSLKARMEVIWLRTINEAAEEGFLCFAEVHQKIRSSWSVNLRMQYFETGSYNSRIYAYESDVLYSFSMPAFYEKGWRCCVNIGVEPKKNLSLWLRYARNFFPEQKQMGSGVDLIESDRRSQARAQIMFTF
ncbi:MAG TPA: helix-hairpin-helix domain-containing protein [Flavisolibacter sp.]|nr:helix-hairpin-helix domain-containing protein [Flavisolibacter sp.]